MAKVNGVDVLDPNPDVTVDRVVDLTLPDDGIRIVRVLLSMGCMGTRSSFGPDGTTCVDAGHRAGLPSEGTTDLKALPTTSSVAKWSRAAERPCAGAVNVERPCVPGGCSILGSTEVAGFSDSLHEEPVPLRAVVLSALRMDRTEFTVGRYRQLLKKGGLRAEAPRLRNTADTVDSWRACAEPGVQPWRSEG